jgi:uncharacterized protein (TIGR00106 family)
MVLLEFSMSPMDKGESVGQYVARSLDIIDKSGVPYRLNPMGTVLEGEWDEVFAVVRNATSGCGRTASGSRSASRWITARARRGAWSKIAAWSR